MPPNSPGKALNSTGKRGRSVKRNQGTKSAFFRSLSKKQAYAVANVFYNYFALGIVLILLGSVLPALQKEYGLDYKTSGLLLSMQSVGYLIVSLAAGYMSVYIGLKRSYVILAAGSAVGMTMLLLSGNPVWLFCAMALVGFSKGASTNYNNQIMSELSNGDAGPINVLHACFAIGACLGPLIVLLCSGFDPTGWHMAVIAAAVLSLIGVVLSSRMKLEERSAAGRNKTKTVSYGFFREKIFWVICLIVFFDQCVETTMMGWLTSFYSGTGIASGNSSQYVTTVLWISLLAGRMICSVVSGRVRPPRMILILSASQLVFLSFLLRAHTLPLMLAATIGLGLSTSGMYGTSVAGTGDLFSRYPVCMGFFTMLASLGAVIAPQLVGIVADRYDIRAGLAVLLPAAAAQLLMAVYLAAGCKKMKGGNAGDRQ